MAILSAQSIRDRCVDIECVRVWKNPMVVPFIENGQYRGMSYGLSSASYDIRVGAIQAGGRSDWQSYTLAPGGFILLASQERLCMPNDLSAMVHDKSTLARHGLALQNTFLDPGFEGWVTLELSNHGMKPYVIFKGQPIAQLVFHTMDQPTEMPYNGKYQNQGAEPQGPIHAKE